LNLHVQFINARFREWTAPLAEADGLVRQKYQAYQREQDRIAAEARAEEERRQSWLRERERLERAAALEDGQPEPQPIDPPAPVAPMPEPSRTVRSALGTTSTRKVWDFEVVDPEAVPNTFKTINEQAIRAAVRAGERRIPGVRVFQKDELAVRAR